MPCASFCIKTAYNLPMKRAPGRESLCNKSSFLHPRFLYYFFCILRDKYISTAIAVDMYRVNAPRISWGVYTKNRVCVSIPGENGTPGGNRKERSDGTAIVRRKAQSRHVISAAPTGVQKRPGMRQHTRRKWYSRRESNPQRPLRSCTYFVNRGKYHPFFCKIGIKIGF